MTEAYPLYWPEHRPRSKRRERARFVTSLGIARDSLLNEVRRLGGVNTVLSTDIPLRRDGLPYAGRQTPDDPGAAVYFTYKGNAMCFACDRWDRVHDNIQAIRKTIEALRGVARWGTGDMMEAAFRGFEALPAPSWRDDLGIGPDATIADAEASYRKRARTAHPDAGGSVEDMTRLNTAISEARQRLSQ